MTYRQTLQTTAELAHWYRQKYEDMGGAWYTPRHELEQHLNDAGVGVKDSRTLLDIGCGDGSLVRVARERGMQAWGVDVAPVKSSEWHYLGDVCCSAFEDILPYDFITSLGSLEHVIDIDAALGNIHSLLKPTGRFYFFVPNELWVHEDQPNERTATDLEWKTLFMNHGLKTDFEKRWNDSTAFGGVKL